MKIKLNERGFILAEFVIALPLLILLLYALVTLTLTAAKIAREQVADYVLETEAQEVIDRITADARAAQAVTVKKVAAYSSGQEFYEIMFVYSTIDNMKVTDYPKHYLREVLDTRRYTVDNYHIISKRVEDNYNFNPITGGNFYGDTTVTQFEFAEIAKNVLHITLEMQSLVTNQKVKFSTAVYMPACTDFKISL